MEKKVIELEDTRYLFREILLFKVEWIFYLAATMFAFIFFLGNILLILLNNGKIEIGNVIVLAIPIVVLLFLTWGIYIIKVWFYMPTGRRVPAIFFLKNGKAYLTNVVPPDDKLVKHRIFNNEPYAVTQMRKHSEMNSDKPLLIFAEGHAMNINVHDLISRIPSTWDPAELDAILRTDKATATAKEREKHVNLMGKLSTPQAMLAIATILACVLIVALLMSQGGAINEMAVNISHINEVITDGIKIDTNSLVQLQQGVKVSVR